MKYRIGIVVADFNKEITSIMLQVAEDLIAKENAEVKKVFNVPGVFDMPLAVKTLAARPEIDGIVTLGCVIKGETKHDEVVVHTASAKISELSLSYHKPISLGIIGPGVTRAQSEARKEEYAKRAVLATLHLLKTLKS